MLLETDLNREACPDSSVRLENSLAQDSVEVTCCTVPVNIMLTSFRPIPPRCERDE
jgi:hypothetical protein